MLHLHLASFCTEMLCLITCISIYASVVNLYGQAVLGYYQEHMSCPKRSELYILPFILVLIAAQRNYTRAQQTLTIHTE